MENKKSQFKEFNSINKTMVDYVKSDPENRALLSLYFDKTEDDFLFSWCGSEESLSKMLETSLKRNSACLDILANLFKNYSAVDLIRMSLNNIPEDD